jgi:hypothetical protein
MTVVRITVNSLVSSTGWDAEGPVTVAKLSTDDGGSSSVYSPNSGNVMRFGVDASSIPNGATINSIGLGMSFSKPDPDDAIVRLLMWVGSNSYESGNYNPGAQNSYIYSSPLWTFNSNPTNGQPFTKSDIAALNIGAKKENSPANRVSYLFIDVDYTSGSTGPSIKRYNGSSFVAVTAVKI